MEKKTSKRIRCYIAGPMYRKTKQSFYSPVEIWQHIKKAITIGMELYKKGYAPYIPHLNALVDMVMDSNMKGEEWVEEFDFPWLEQCEALYYIGNSLGANQELKHAQELGLKVYRRLKDVPRI